MRNEQAWKATKYVRRNSRLVASHDPANVAVASRLISDLVAALYADSAGDHCSGHVIDVGCGKAPLYGVYRPHVKEVTCVDWKDSSGGPSFLDLEHDLTEPLPFASSTFDTVILSDVLEHIPNPQHLVAELARILTPGGKMLLNVPFFYCIHESPHDYHRYTEFALRRMLDQAGFRVLRLDAIGGLPEVWADLCAKTLALSPLIGSTIATSVQWMVALLSRTSLWKNVSRRTSGRFPLGYFVVAVKPE